MILSAADVVVYDLDHLWHVAIPPRPAGDRRVGKREPWWRPTGWRQIYSPEQQEHGFLEDLRYYADDPDERRETPPVEYAHNFTVDEIAAGENDEVWLLFDYGDEWKMRFRFNGLHTRFKLATAARRQINSGAVQLPEGNAVSFFELSDG